jgi:formylglycine-generating enzyme required for sulfatase activity
VPPKELVSFAEGRFALRDGSLLTGTLAPETLRIATRFGDLQVPSVAVKAIRAIPETLGSGSSAGALARLPPTGMAPLALGSTTFVNSIGMVFVLVPAGKFAMGSEDGDYDERPVHEVLISQPFYLGRYEVTQGQWAALMGNNPSHFTGDLNLPVEQVSWEDAQRFVEELNSREGVAAYRLPTEAEWEYAARAETDTVYSFGDDVGQLGENAWYGDNAGGSTHRVGQRKPNVWGLYDMHGNVWEWVQDWYGRYDADDAVDPQGVPAGAHRVYRGGGWGTFAVNCRSSDRNFAVADARLAGVGFRLARAAHRPAGAPRALADP